MAMGAPPSATRPRVLINFASSLDGKINPAPGHRPAKFMMSRHREDFRRMVALRGRVDAVLIGAANLRADNPDLAIPADERDHRRATRAAEPLRIVVTRTGAGITPDMRMFDPARGGAAIVVHTTQMPADVRARLAPVAELIELGNEAVPVDALLGVLFARGVRTLLCEGGGDISAQFFAARAVDEIYLTLVPRILGGARAPTLAAGLGFDPDEIPDARLASLEQIGDEIYLRYEIQWN
jgi:5-amino-6-(5-phosphoribosylamino)uracil reductase